MKIRLKIIECIQAISILSMIVSATLILGGAEYQEQWSDFVWQFRTGISYILLSVVIAGCMELLKRYEHYRARKLADSYLVEIFESIEKAQRRCNSNRATK